MPVNIFELGGYTPKLFEHEPINIFISINSRLTEKPEDDWYIPVVHAEHETSKPWVEIIDNRPLTASYLQLTLSYLKTIGENTTRGRTSGIVIAQKTTTPSGVIAKTINQLRQAGSGRTYLSSDGTTL